MEHNFQPYKLTFLANDFYCKNCGLIKRIEYKELGGKTFYFQSRITSFGVEGYWDVSYVNCSEYIMQQILK